MQKLKTTLLFLFLSLNAFSQNDEKIDNCKCCETEFRQFDFWLGEWDVTQKGLSTGTNKLIITQDNCLIIENWNSATSDYSGTSYNYYDKKTKMWYQTWVDNIGGNLRLKGVLKNGKMVLMEEPNLNQKSGSQINKITWTPNEDGTVRQLWENPGPYFLMACTSQGKNKSFPPDIVFLNSSKKLIKV